MKSAFFLTLTALLVVMAAAGSLSATQAVEETGYLPQFETTKPNIEVLEENLTKTGVLAEILKRGNDELSEAIKQHRTDRTVESKDRIYGLLGGMAGKTVDQIDNIIANKDQMKDGLTQIIYKMDHIQASLDEKQQKFGGYVDKTVAQATAVKDELRAAARAIKKDPENRRLRLEFRRKLFRLRNLDNRQKTYKAHQRLNDKFGEQVAMADQFFQQLDANMDQLVLNLNEQKEFLVMRVGLLKDAAEMESWLRGEGESNLSALAMMRKIGDLSKALEKFNAAADVMVEMNDIGTLIESLPDASEMFGLEGDGAADGANLEDKYVEYFLIN